MIRKSSLLALLTLILLLSACLPEPTTTAPASPTAPSRTVAPTRTATQTGTIQWFPATRTPSPMPTAQALPTLEQHPGVGAPILSDDFSNPANWSTGEAEAGTVSAGGGSLSLANPGVKGMLLSFRKATNLTDFYLELTSNLGLCRGDDNYGVLVRSASLQDYYRFLIACNGQIRLERVKNGQIALLQDWTFSGQVPPGSPLVLKLGVWAVGSDLRFFINDVFQFAAKDSVLTVGTVGVFARASGQNPLTVSFSDLKVSAVDRAAIPTPALTPSPTPTATRTRAPLPQTPTPVFKRTP